MRELIYAGAAEIVEKIRLKEISAQDYLETLLARVEAVNGEINAVVARNAEAARARAREADEAAARGESWGPLHGLSMTVKDSIEVAGMPCTSGAPALRDHRPARNAVSVQRLLDAGAIVYGKTNLPLYAGDLQSYNEVYGTTNNPWDTARGPGGSSGGAAAALAAGMTALEIGSDIGGSIRNPASFCGVYGHKPSWGIVPGEGHIPPPPGLVGATDIAVLGPMARNAADLDLALGLMAGPHGPDARGWRLDLPAPTASALSDYRIAVWPEEPDFPLDRGVAEALNGFADRLATAGAKVERAKPGIDFARHHGMYYQLLSGVMGAGLPEPMREEFRRQVAEGRAEGESYGARFTRGAVQSHADWLAANEERARAQRIWDEFFGAWDAVLCPVTPTAAFPHDHSPEIGARTMRVNGEDRPYMDYVLWAGLTGSVGLPSTVMPAGLTAEGLPVGVQIVGPFAGDRICIDIAARASAALGGFVPPPGY